MRSQILCNGDYLRPIKIECMDWEKNGKHQLIGVAETSIQQWVESSVRDFPLINQERKAKKGSKYKNSGVIKLAKLQIRHVPTFTEYCKRSGSFLTLFLIISSAQWLGNKPDCRN